MNTSTQVVTPTLFSAKITAPIISLCSDVLSDKYTPRTALYQIVATSLATHAAIAYLDACAGDAERISMKMLLHDYKGIIVNSIDHLSVITDRNVLTQALVASLSQYSELKAETFGLIDERLDSADFDDIADLMIKAADDFFKESFTNQFTILLNDSEPDSILDLEGFCSNLRGAEEALSVAADFCLHRASFTDIGAILGRVLRKLA